MFTYRKLSANEQFFCQFVLESSKFVTNNSNYIKHLFYVATLLTASAQIKPKSSESRRNSFLFYFLPGVDASHVVTYVLGC